MRRRRAGSVGLDESTGARVRLNEDVAASGLDPALYLGVFEADLGVGGVVNLNGRIYPVEDFVRENQALSVRAKEAFVDLEVNHPEDGPTFNVAARLLGVEVTVERRVARARGRFALVNNEHGRNMLVLIRAGMDIGTSSRGYGIPVPHVLDAKSPYLEANAPHAGETVLEIRSFQLETYDLVRVPSAGTYVDPPTTEAREALTALCEAQVLREAPVPEHVPTSEPDEAQEDSMDPKTIAELRQKFPGLVAEIEAESRKANPFANLDEGKRKLATEIALRAVEALDPKAGDAAVDPALAGAVAKLTTDVAEASRKAEEAAQTLRDRIKAVEETNESLRRDNERLVEERERDKLARQLAEAVDAACKGNKHAARLRTWLESKVAGGALKTAAAVAEEAKSFGEALEGAVAELRSATAGKAPVTPVDEASGDAGITEPATEGADAAPGLLGEDAFLDSIFKATEQQLCGTNTRT